MALGFRARGRLLLLAALLFWLSAVCVTAKDQLQAIWQIKGVCVPTAGNDQPLYDMVSALNGLTSVPWGSGVYNENYDALCASIPAALGHEGPCAASRRLRRLQQDGGAPAPEGTPSPADGSGGSGGSADCSRAKWFVYLDTTDPAVAGWNPDDLKAKVKSKAFNTDDLLPQLQATATMASVSSVSCKSAQVFALPDSSPPADASGAPAPEADGGDNLALPPDTGEGGGEGTGWENGYDLNATDPTAGETAASGAEGEDGSGAASADGGTADGTYTSGGGSGSSSSSSGSSGGLSKTAIIAIAVGGAVGLAVVVAVVAVFAARNGRAARDKVNLDLERMRYERDMAKWMNGSISRSVRASERWHSFRDEHANAQERLEQNYRTYSASMKQDKESAPARSASVPSRPVATPHATLSFGLPVSQDAEVNLESSRVLGANQTRSSTPEVAPQETSSRWFGWFRRKG